MLPFLLRHKNTMDIQNSHITKIKKRFNTIDQLVTELIKNWGKIQRNKLKHFLRKIKSDKII